MCRKVVTSEIVLRKVLSNAMCLLSSLQAANRPHYRSHTCISSPQKSSTGLIRSEAFQLHLRRRYTPGKQATNLHKYGRASKHRGI
jgi:hypothetical protein